MLLQLTIKGGNMKIKSKQLKSWWWQLFCTHLTQLFFINMLNGIHVGIEMKICSFFLLKLKSFFSQTTSKDLIFLSSIF